MHMSTTSHNAGTIIGQIYGVAKKATAIAVRVFDATGKGSSAYVLHYYNIALNCANLSCIIACMTCIHASIIHNNF